MKQILCFGDSNTWGYNPKTGERFDWGVRWTSILQDKVRTEGIHIIEEGLCGRTSVFEDALRKGRRGIDTLPILLESHAPLDVIVVMLGTNDSKTIYHANENIIGHGIENLLQLIRRIQPQTKILLVSPIHLGSDIWKEGYDPEFDKQSIAVSQALKKVYQELAQKYQISFLAASDYAQSSAADQEHMDERNHEKFANAVERELKKILAAA